MNNNKWPKNNRGVNDAPIFEKLTDTEKLYRQNKELNDKLLALEAKLEEQEKQSSEKLKEINKNLTDSENKLESAKLYNQQIRKELERYNPWHLYLEKEIIIPHCPDPLRCRLSAPAVQWKDDEDVGMVKLHVAEGNATRFVGYAFSRAALMEQPSYIKDMVVRDTAERIAAELSECIENEFKELK
jgi:cell division septum initiation protein DivIVA